MSTNSNASKFILVIIVLGLFGIAYRFINKIFSLELPYLDEAKLLSRIC